jgi:hypothetical protein
MFELSAATRERHLVGMADRRFDILVIGGGITGPAWLGLPPAAGRRLVERYGDDWEEALKLLRDDRSLGEEAIPGLPVL